MASQSAPPPPNPGDVNPQNPEIAQPIVDDRQDAKDISPPSVFVNSEPVREDQVQNAVKFLSHPKVKGSPVIYRRSFLERKGLTKQEIDEAFRRVPDTTPTVGQPAVANRDGQLSSSSNMQQPVPTQAPQPAAAIPSATLSKAGTVAHSWLGWQQILLAVGVLAISGAGTAVFVKNSIVPRLKSWIRKVVSEEDENFVKKTGLKPSVEEEAAAAAKAAAAAAADVARANQEILSYRSGEKRYFEELLTQLDKQVQEMKSMSNAIKNLEVKSGISGHEDNRVLLPGSVASYANGKSDFNFLSGRSVSPPMFVEPPTAPHLKSYTEITNMAQRGEKPPNIREINDHTSNPNQPVPNPRVVPRPKPWEVGQVQNSLNLVPQFQDKGLANNQLNGDSSLSWWQQNNVRINEIESDNEYKAGSSAFPTTDRPVQRSWVPPLPPPVAMAEAAAAIRQPKKSTYQSEALTDDQLFARSSELTDELQRITKISESGSATEANGGRFPPNTEIRTGQGNSYVEA